MALSRSPSPKKSKLSPLHGVDSFDGSKKSKKKRKKRRSSKSSSQSARRSMSKEQDMVGHEIYPPRERERERNRKARPPMRIHRMVFDSHYKPNIYEKQTYAPPESRFRRSLRNKDLQKRQQPPSSRRSGSGRRPRRFGSRSRSPGFRNKPKVHRRHRSSRFDDSPFVANGSRKKRKNVDGGIEYFPDLENDQGRKTRFDRAPSASKRDRRKDRRRRSNSPRNGKYSRSPRSGSSTPTHPTAKSSRSKKEQMKSSLYDFSDMDLQRNEKAKDATKEGSDDEFSAEKFYEEETRNHDEIRHNTSLSEVIAVPDHGKLSPGIKPPKGDGHFPKEITGVREVSRANLEAKMEQVMVPEIKVLPTIIPTDPRLQAKPIELKPDQANAKQTVVPEPVSDQLSDMDMSDSETEKDAQLLEESKEPDPPAAPEPKAPKSRNHSARKIHKHARSTSELKKHKRAKEDHSRAKDREEKKKKKKRKRSKDLERKKVKERKRHKHKEDSSKDGGLGKSAGMKLRNGTAPDQFCLCIDGIREDATEDAIYKEIESVEGLRDTKIYTGKSCRFVLCDFESKETMRAFWRSAHCGKHGIDKFGFQVEVFEDPFGLISTKVFTLLNNRIRNSTEFKCSTTAYIPSEPLLCMTHSKFFESTEESKVEENVNESKPEETAKETKSEETAKQTKPEEIEKEGTSESRKEKGNAEEGSKSSELPDSAVAEDPNSKKQEAEDPNSKNELKEGDDSDNKMEVQEVKIEIPMHMFEFKPPEEELKRKEPTPEPVVDKVEIPVGSAAKLPANSPNSSDSMDAEKTDDTSESKNEPRPPKAQKKQSSKKEDKPKKLDIPEIKKKRKHASKRKTSVSKKKRKSDSKVGKRGRGRPRKKPKTSTSPRIQVPEMSETNSSFPLELVKDVGKAFKVSNTTSTQQSDDIVASLKQSLMSFSTSNVSAAPKEEAPKKPAKSKPLLPRRKRKPPASQIIKPKSKPEISSKPPESMKRKRASDSGPQRKRKKLNDSDVSSSPTQTPRQLEAARIALDSSDSDGDQSAAAEKKDPIVLKKLADSGFQRSVYTKIQQTFPRRILSWEDFSTVTDEEFRQCDLNDGQIAILRALTAEHVIDPIQEIPQMQMPSSKPRKHENGCLRCEPYNRRTNNGARHWASKVAKKNAQHASVKKTRHRRRVQSDQALLRVNSLSFRTKKLKFEKSTIHAWGVFAMENIERNEQVVEYIGEYISPEIADERQQVYQENGIDDYMFRANDDVIIDATMKGNIARFVNHSCDPNCYTRPLLVDDTPRVVIYAKRQIMAGEELTYDYKFPLEEIKIPCHCGAKSCRGFLN